MKQTNLSKLYRFTALLLAFCVLGSSVVLPVGAESLLWMGADTASGWEKLDAETQNLAEGTGFLTRETRQKQGGLLRLNGVEESTLICGKPEHTHNEQCRQAVAVCGQEEGAYHEHDDACLEPQLICRLPVQEAHQHEESCYGITEAYFCGKEEAEAHAHSVENGCFTEKSTLTCTKQEAAHNHDETCTVMDKKLTCKLSTEPHVHGDSCFKTVREDICMLPEVAEHKHTDGCFGEPAVICGNTDPAHTHEDACYAPGLTCGLEETEGHTHEKGVCYTETTEIVCGKETGEAHVHTDGCYTETPRYTCGLQVSEGHSHGAECYKTEQQLTCTKPEGEGHAHTDQCKYGLICTKTVGEGHVHGDACYAPACNLPTDVAHRHDESCYGKETVLICKLEEHRHSDACYRSALLEQTVEDWMKLVSVTGDLPEGVSLQAQILYGVQNREELKAQILDYLRDGEEVAFGYDIWLELDGAEYQPESAVTVTVKVPAVVLDTLGYDSVAALAENLSLYHIHEGEVSPIRGIAADGAAGTLTFDVDNFSTFVGTLQKDNVVVLTAGGGYQFYSDVGCTSPIGGSHSIEKAMEYLYVKADSGYSIDAIAVHNADGTPSAAICIGPVNGIYTLVIPDTVTQNQIITVDVRMVAHVSDLIDVNLALVKWRSRGCVGSLTIQLGGAEYTVTEDTYEQAYGAVYAQLLQAANYTAATLSQADLVGDIIWKLPAGAALSSDLTVPAGVRLIIVSQQADAALTMNYLVDVSGGIVSVQGSDPDGRIVLDGNGSFTRNGTDVSVTRRSNRENLFRMNAGSVYFAYADIANAVYYQTSTTTQSGAILIYASGVTNIFAADLNVYDCMGTSGAFLSDTKRNLTSKEGAEYSFYQCNFSNCITHGVLTNSGGSVIFAGQGKGVYTFEQCNFFNNYSMLGGTESDICDNGGGAVRWQLGDSKVSTGRFNNCAFYDNYAVGHGGAIFANGSLELNNCSIYNNKASISGGGVFVKPATQTSSDTSDEYKQGKIGSVTFGQGTEIYNNEVLGYDEKLAPVTGVGGGIHVEVAISKVASVVRPFYDLYTYIDGASIHDNRADNGGGIAMEVTYDYNCGVYIYEGSSVYDNEAINGAGVYITSNKVYTGNKGFHIEGGAVYGNIAEQNGGAVYVASGSAYLTGGELKSNGAQNGGGAYVTGGDVTMTGGTLLGNNAVQSGGGVYLTGGDFTLDGANAQIDSNSAQSGAGVYLVGGTPDLRQGALRNNIATGNGGGIYIDKQIVQLKPTGTVSLQGNKATGDGGGVYINGTVNGSDAGFAVQNTGGRVELVENSAKNGGGVCVNNGYFTMDYDNIRMAKNNAQNGGGVAVLAGNFTMSAGALGESGGANTANIGGGVYVSGGAATVNGGSIQYNTATQSGGGVAVNGGQADIHSGTVQHNSAPGGGGVAVDNGSATIDGGAVQYNTAQNGGGAYVSGGDLTLAGGSIKANEASVDGAGFYVATGNFLMKDGSISGNEAARNGGGGYVNGGDFRMEGGVIGGEANTATNGGGICVADGSILIINGEIDGNEARENGGGVHVSAATRSVHVEMLSGYLRNNTAQHNGGGMAVVTDTAQQVTVKIGCLMDHKVNGEFSHTPNFIYSGEYSDYSTFKHAHCPIVQANTAENDGGGFYLNGQNSNLVFYCVEELDNKAANSTDCYSLDVEGGKVIIGDSKYHNIHNSPDATPEGFADFGSTILVTGGQVDIYGDMNNPFFAAEVTVDIQPGTDSYYVDHRRSADVEIYKVHYVENFLVGTERTGLYIAQQYTAEGSVCNIDVVGSTFNRPGYKIIGWNTQPDGSGKRYEVGTTYDLCKLTEADGLGAATSCNETCCTGANSDTKILKLYAQWERKGYVVRFMKNQPEGATVSGTMEDMACTQGEANPLPENQYKSAGYVFLGWARNAEADEPEFEYKEDRNKLYDLTTEDSVLVRLYAVWEKCVHPENKLTYEADGNVLIQTCPLCRGERTYGHKAEAEVFAVDVNYDEHAHGAELYVDGNWIGDNPEMIYFKVEDSWDSVNNDCKLWLEGTTYEPIHAGQYTASIEKKGIVAEQAYEIRPIQWNLPKTPAYEYSSGTKTITIVDPVSDEAKRYEYRCNEIVPEQWKDENTFPIATFNKYYYFDVRQKADRDHTASDYSRSPVFLSENGSSIVYFIVDEGIDNAIVSVPGQENTLKFQTGPKDGYHRRGWSVSITKDSVNGELLGAVPEAVENGTEIYSITLTDAAAFYVTIIGVEKTAGMTVQAEKGQIFDTISNENELNISRDSAFTVQYALSNYQSDEYAGLQLDFSSALPVGANIIMMTAAADGTPEYWYYPVDNNTPQTVALGAFRPMGSNGSNYSCPTDRTELTFRFVVDFSQSTSGALGNELTMKLNLTPVSLTDAQKAVWQIPAVSGEKSVNLHNVAAFSLTASGDVLTVQYTASQGHASIWQGRSGALVLTLKDNVTVPVDLKLTVVAGAEETDYALRDGNKFIIPLGELQDYTVAKTLRLALKSALFTAPDGKLTFDAHWYVAATQAARAPMEGTKEAETAVTLAAAKQAKPSVRIDSSQRICTVGGTLSAKVTMENIPADWKVTAYLLREQRKEDGSSEYVDTAYKQELSGTKDYVFALTGQAAGNFCLQVIVSNGTGGNQVNLLEARHYFILETEVEPVQIQGN